MTIELDPVEELALIHVCQKIVSAKLRADSICTITEERGDALRDYFDGKSELDDLLARLTNRRNPLYKGDVR